MYEKLPFLMEVAIEPKSAADADKLAAALKDLTSENARLATTIDRESGQTILSGIDEVTLEDACDQLNELGIQYNVGAPQVMYRETLTRAVTIEYVHQKISGPRAEFALVRIAFEPIHGDAPMQNFTSITFENAAQDSIPPEFAAAVEKGIRAQAEVGLKAGFPVVDVYATLVRAAYHEIDSSERTFDIAARTAFRELAKEDAIQIVEPFMRIEVATPDYYLGGVIGDLNSRRGQVLETTGSQIYQLVTALVPLANMYGYRNTLHSMCRGSAVYEMRFDHFEPVPGPRGDDPTFPGAIGMRVA